jgi:hypothetical protein
MQGENWDYEDSQEWGTERTEQQWQSSEEIKQEAGHYLSQLKLSRLSFEERLGLVASLLD